MSASTTCGDGEPDSAHRRRGRYRWWNRRNRRSYWQANSDGQRIIWIGFDVLESELAWRVSFPISLPMPSSGWTRPMAGVANCLVKRETRFDWRCWNRPPGRRSPPMEHEVACKLDPAANELVFATLQAGVYRLRLGRMTRSSVSTCSTRRSSNIKRVTNCNWGSSSKGERATTKRTNMECEHNCGAGAVVLLGSGGYYIGGRCEDF